MGSGKRNYKKRPKKFSLGGYKPEKTKVEISEEDKKKFIEFWGNQKKKSKTKINL